MNLADMAAQVCADTGYLDTDDLTFAKQALRMRDDLLWRVGLWKDSLVQVNLTVDPETNEDHAAGVVYLPEVVERVVAVRTADHALAVSGLETFYRAAFDTFATTGEPWEFAKLSPAWFTWRGQLGLKITNSAGDDSQEIRVTWQDGNGVRTTTLITLESGSPAVLGTALTDANYEADTITVAGAGEAEANGVYTLTSAGAAVVGAQGRVWTNEAGCTIDHDGGWNINNSGGDILYSTSSDASSPTAVAFNTIVDGAAPAPDSVALTTVATIVVESVFAPELGAALTIGPQLAIDAAGATLAAGETTGTRYNRIRLLPIPVAETTLKILAKAQYVPLDFDYAEPKITGSHLCLMAFAKHSLRKRAGEHGAAEMDLQEATGLLETLKREELQQEANNQRIIPSYGYGDQWFGPGRDGFFVG